MDSAESNDGVSNESGRSGKSRPLLPGNNQNL